MVELFGLVQSLFGIGHGLDHVPLSVRRVCR
jgi:hypothetical protein